MKYKKVFISVIIMGILFLFANRISIIASVGVVINSANELLAVARKQLDGMLFGIIMICLCSVIGIVLCILIAELIDFKGRKSMDAKALLSENIRILMH